MNIVDHYTDLTKFVPLTVAIGDEIAGHLPDLVNLQVANQLNPNYVRDFLSEPEDGKFVFYRYRTYPDNSRVLLGFVGGYFTVQNRDRCWDKGFGSSAAAEVREGANIRMPTYKFSIKVVMSRPGYGKPIMSAFVHADLLGLRAELESRRVIFELSSVLNKINFYRYFDFKLYYNKNIVGDHKDELPLELPTLQNGDVVYPVGIVNHDADGLPRMYLKRNF